MKTPYKFVPLDVATPMLRPGDVALYRGHSITSAAIAAVTSSPYTHVGIIVTRPDACGGGIGASIIEFREWYGGREVDLGGEVNRSDGRIDIYRFPEVFHEYRFNEISGRIEHVEKAFDGERVVSIMRRLTGLPYHYKRLVCIYAWKLPCIRCLLCSRRKGYTDDRIDHLRLSRFICSTAVDYAFEKAGYSLVQNKNTNYVDPSDIARSTNLHYMFTLSHPRHGTLEGEWSI